MRNLNITNSILKYWNFRNWILIILLENQNSVCLNSSVEFHRYKKFKEIEYFFFLNLEFTLKNGRNYFQKNYRSESSFIKKSGEIFQFFQHISAFRKFIKIYFNYKYFPHSKVRRGCVGARACVYSSVSVSWP